MLKSFLSYGVIFSAIFSSLLFAQNSNSLQITGGIISPLYSSNGLSASLQFNFEPNRTVNYYAYIGYSTWDRFNVIFHTSRQGLYYPSGFKTYATDEHRLIPVFVGSKINFHRNKFLTSFVALEIGYSCLIYKSYLHKKAENPETGEILGYSPDLNTEEEVRDNLISVGLGLGISHPMSEILDLVLTIKLNSNIYSEREDIFHSRETYTSFLCGFNFHL